MQLVSFYTSSSIDKTQVQRFRQNCADMLKDPKIIATDACDSPRETSLKRPALMLKMLDSYNVDLLYISIYCTVTGCLRCRVSKVLRDESKDLFLVGMPRPIFNHKKRRNPNLFFPDMQGLTHSSTAMMLIKNNEGARALLNEWAEACNEASPEEWARDVLAGMNPPNAGVIPYQTLSRTLVLETGVYA